MRLDIFLTEHGYTSSRTKAQEIISRGFVFVNNKEQTKSNFQVEEKDYIEVRNMLPFVSRGGEKLAPMLEYFDIDPKGLHVLDIGSSTGGFTDVVLQKGASSVTAVDVGTKQFDDELSKHPRIYLFEKTDIRDFYSDKVFDLIVIDLSFISQKEIIPHLKRFCKKGTHIVSLIKPQFEIGRHGIGKGGLVIEHSDSILDMLESIKIMYAKQGFASEMDIVPSTIKGKGGNQEYFIHLIFKDSLM